MDYPINYNILAEDFREQRAGTRGWSQADAEWLYEALCKMCDAYDTKLDDASPTACPYGQDGEAVCCGRPEACQGPTRGRVVLEDEPSV